jgi:mono/diheme cytochrome c family protein
MVHIFFWAWFFEYFVFFGEIILLLLIYFKWDALLARNRQGLLLLGTWYVVFALLSAFSITAILGFMLTPGEWLYNGNFWSGFFNPSFPPQLASRLSFSFIIGALVALGAVVFWGDDSFRPAAVRLFGTVLLIATAAFAVSLLIYLSVTPRAFASHIPFAVLTSHFSRYPTIFSVGNIVLFGLLFACAFAALHSRTGQVRLLIIPSALAIILLVAQFECIREFVRGPYLMPGHMYANGIMLEEMPFLQKNGLIAGSPWFAAAYPQDDLTRGAFLFAQNCMICHSVGGINDISDRVKGRSEDGLYVILGHVHEMVPFMPPFAGTDAERALLAEYLFQLTNGEIHFMERGRALPARVNAPQKKGAATAKEEQW